MTPRRLLIIFAIPIVFLIAAAVTYAVSSPYVVSASDAKQALAQGGYDVVLDVRTALERDTLGSYPGSIHIPSADLAAQAPTQIPNRSARILVYCNTGQRARRATEILHSLGYTNARYIASSHLSLM